jgi:hypothetical protein
MYHGHKVDADICLRSNCRRLKEDVKGRNRLVIGYGGCSLPRHIVKRYLGGESWMNSLSERRMLCSKGCREHGVGVSSFPV